MNYFIGHCEDENVRYCSSSGGIGTAVIQYLLSLPDFCTAMTFVFDREKCAYEPKLIYSYEEYNNCGSIYQDTDTVGFIRNNLKHIKGGLIVTCMPCQVRSIRNILERNNIPSFIISLCCSGQTTIEGTWHYYKLLGIEKTSVKKMQYRGNGWPSGIQIELDNGATIKKDNWTYPWTIIYRSMLFRPHRCLLCTQKTNSESDINLADPWLKEYEGDRIGNSVVIANTDLANNILKDMVSNGEIALNCVPEQKFIESQKGTIEIKADTLKHKGYYNFIWKLSCSKMYRSFALANSVTLKLNNYFISFVKKICK